MVTPTVTETKLRLEPVVPDRFIDPRPDVQAQAQLAAPPRG